MKNRKRETCTSGSVRDEDGNILIYSAKSRRSSHMLGMARFDPFLPFVSAQIPAVLRPRGFNILLI
jgi:hypothetical protein